jgi:LysM repeat protein
MPKRIATALRAVVMTASLATVTAPVLSAQVVPAPTNATASSNSAVVKHTVKRGDTLWDIAKYYLKDPFKWPQVFHANTDIVKNPHWIYPGQVLTIEASAVKPEVAARAGGDGFVVAQIQTQAQAPTVFADQASAPARQAVGATEVPPALTVRPGEYEAAPYVVPDRSPLAVGRVVGAVDIPALGLLSDAGFKLFDRIYVTPPAGVSFTVGEREVVARTDATITDVGRVIEPTGIIRIDSIGAAGRAVGVIVKQFGAIVPGQGIVPLGQSFERTTVRPVDGSYALTAKLLWVQGSPRLPSIQTYVIIGANESRGVRLGDQFSLLDEAAARDGRAAAIQSTATVTIVRVTPLAASGIVVRQTQPEIRTGMPARLTAKMP